MFNVGDRVISIKGDSFGLTDDKLKHIKDGTVGKIIRIYQDDSMLDHEVDFGGDMAWNYTADELKLAKEESMDKLKVGDRVTVLPTSILQKYIGESGVISSFDFEGDPWVVMDGNEHELRFYAKNVKKEEQKMPQIKTGHLVMTTFDNAWRLAQVDTTNKGIYPSSALYSLRDFSYIPIQPKGILKIAEVLYIGDIFRVIQDGADVESISTFKIIYDKTKVEREDKLQGIISDLQDKLDKAQKELKEVTNVSM